MNMFNSNDTESNMNLQPSRGFTLIELSMVVAILSILVATAIPAYQQFAIRASVSEALVGVSPVKTDLVDFFSKHGRFPADAAERMTFRITPADLHPTFRNLNIHGVGACNPSAGCSQARVEIQLQRDVYRGVDGDSHSQLRLEGLATPGGTITWKCGPRDVQPLKLEWLPSTCRDSF